MTLSEERSRDLVLLQALRSLKTSEMSGLLGDRPLNLKMFQVVCSILNSKKIKIGRLD